MTPRRFAAGFALLALSFGCAATRKPQPPPREALIFLLPDDQGKTGSIVVSNPEGERVLSAPREAVKVSAGAGPGKPFVIPEKEVKAAVGPALEALPPPPVRFILYFRRNSDELTRESLARLPEILRHIRERAPVDIGVVGHTDSVGDNAYNCRLSLKRARAMAALLAAEGVDPSILEIASHGKHNPLVPTGDQVAEPRNRRVEVTVR